MTKRPLELERDDYMTEEKKQSFLLGLSLLKTAMKEEGLIFGIMVDPKKPEESKLAAIDKYSFIAGKRDGVIVSLDELNKDLW